MMKRTEKRYYKVGESVWVRSENAIGVIKELNIKPQEGIYEATVEIARKDGDTTTITTKTYKLWEIDKNKRTLFKQKRKMKKLLKKDTVLFAKVYDDAIIPSKRDEDGGYDVYASLKGIREKYGHDFVYIEPFQVKLIPTGIASSLLPKYRFIFKERGSTGTRCMAVRAGVIDSGFRGQWFVAINNTGNRPILITPFVQDVVEYEDRIEYPITKAIAQANLEFVPDVNTKEIGYDNLKAIPSKRGEGELGSSNK